MGAPSKSTAKSLNEDRKLEIKHLREDIKRELEWRKNCKANGAGSVQMASIDTSIKRKRERIAYLQNLMKSR